MRRLGIVLNSISLAFVLAWSTTSVAHQLSVFAWVEGDSVRVETHLSKGKHPKMGKVLVYDGQHKLLHESTLQPDGAASIPLKNWETGYRVVVDIGHGHQSYYILTPYDIREQLEERQ